MSDHKLARIDGIRFNIGRVRALAVTSDVFAIEENPKLAFVPGAEAYFLGFFKYASRYVPCFDLASFCGLTRSSDQRMTCLITPTSQGVLAALWVSNIGSVRDLSHAKKPEATIRVPRALGEFLANKCELENDHYVLLDLQRLATVLVTKSVILS